MSVPISVGVVALAYVSMAHRVHSESNADGRLVHEAGTPYRKP